MNSKMFESKMLQEVRRWRKEAYDADRLRTQDEKNRHARELAERLRLKLISARPIAAEQNETRSER